MTPEMTPEMTPDMLRKTARQLLPDTTDFLSRLVQFPSLSGQEHEAMVWLSERFGSALQAEVQEIPMADSLKDDPDYSDPVPGITYDGRFNLRLHRPGKGGGKSLLLNSHTDVVPPSDGQSEPYSGKVVDGVLHGRGACDAKGQVATIYLVNRLLDELGIELAGDLISHVVNEEENGGNGTLAMIRHGEQADGCVTLEPTDGKLFTSIRGAVWFRLELTGKAGHSGQAGVTRSALLMARDAIAILERYHADLLQRSRGLPLFDPLPNPMPITFGKLHAGNWPASAPSEATIEGVLGLLPNVTKEQVCKEMQQALAEGGDSFLAEHAKLSFMYRHDSSVVDPDHALPQHLLAAATALETPLEVSAMTASCDAWFYTNQLAIPTVVYGPGTLAVAHSKDEQIELEQIAEAAAVLTQLAIDYCGRA